MLQGMGHLEGFGGSVLPAPSLLLCQAGSAALPSGTGPAAVCAPGRDPRLQFGDALPARRLQVREGDAAVPGSPGPGSAPPPRRVPGTSRALLNRELPVRNHLRADRRRDGAGGASQPCRVSFSGPLGFQARTGALRGSRMRGGAAALPEVQHSKTREEGTPGPVPGWGASPGQPVRSLRFCFSANSLCCSKIKPESPKQRFAACSDSAEPREHPSLLDRFPVEVPSKNDSWEVTQLTPELPQLSSKPSGSENAQFS
ncbi:uncharacterized protein LOC102071734 isoform X2 [Zonotrichia albicollis]|uniref:uncharacterized protein LOC102071734 isoform X2 n=1 Tax=Zonotrichia albicollis TaxID=44394 RepID=UPI003D80C843